MQRRVYNSNSDTFFTPNSLAEFYYTNKVRAEKAEAFSDEMLRALLRSLSSEDKGIYMNFLKQKYGITKPTIENLQQVKNDFYKFMNTPHKVEDFLFVASIRQNKNETYSHKLAELKNITLGDADFEALLGQFRLDFELSKSSQSNSNTTQDPISRYPQRG